MIEPSDREISETLSDQSRRASNRLESIPGTAREISRPTTGTARKVPKPTTGPQNNAANEPLPPGDKPPEARTPDSGAGAGPIAPGTKKKNKNAVPKVPQRQDSVPLSMANLSLHNAAATKTGDPSVPQGAKGPTEFRKGREQSGLKTANAGAFLRSSPQKGTAQRKTLFSAKRYMQEIWEAESSAATSVVSETTRKKLTGGIGGTVYQDKTYNYLGKFAKEGSAGAVRLLLEKGCNPGTEVNKLSGTTFESVLTFQQKFPRPGPLIFAARGASGRHVKCARVLLEFEADVNVKQSGTGKTPLHFAIENPYYKGYGNLIFELLQNNADPNAADSSGVYPIHKVLHGFNLLPKHLRDALALLLFFDADVEVSPPGTKNKPIHLAVSRKDQTAVAMILEKGASVDEPNGAGVTPLGLAVGAWTSTMSEAQKEVAWQLLEYGAAVDQKIGSSKLTALQHAITYGQVDMVRELLHTYGADVSICGKGGVSAFDLASMDPKRPAITPAIRDELMELLAEAK